MQELFLRGNPISKVKGILFDKDGTLVNSEKRLLGLARERIKETRKLLQKENYAEEIIIKTEKLLSQVYGIYPQSVDPNGCIAIASKKDIKLSFFEAIAMHPFGSTL